MAILLALSFSGAFAVNGNVNVTAPMNCSDLRNCVENCSQIQNCSAYLNCIENCSINATAGFDEGTGVVVVKR